MSTIVFTIDPMRPAAHVVLWLQAMNGPTEKPAWMPFIMTDSTRIEAEAHTSIPDNQRRHLSEKKGARSSTYVRSKSAKQASSQLEQIRLPSHLPPAPTIIHSPT
ncbi:hypothetical protein N656DRAFT_354777 [Canariomyces notabilis]|uniref:Uncharacterized protein n=1 Tax=Canariomyces notabilis TaxID=2074819 RepID=A0AAN6QIX1_9PEZI|nr:hypothetical protein N656DRAFT_354777 [Canariomyces arenarius]